MEFWPVLSCNMISGSLDTLGKQHKRTDQVCYSTVLCSDPSNSRIIGPNLAPHEGFAVVFKGCRIRPFVCKGEDSTGIATFPPHAKNSSQDGQLSQC